MASSAVGDRHWQAGGAAAASTPAHRSSLVICPPSIASCRFSAVSGVGLRMNELTVLPPGVVNGVAVRLSGATAAVDQAVRQRQAAMSGLAHSASAAAPAALPSSLAFFQTSTYCRPLATLFRLAGSPSWPLTGGYGS